MATDLNIVSEVRTFMTSSGRTVYTMNGQSAFDLESLIAACHDASCRPPTSGGTGGSSRNGPRRTSAGTAWGSTYEHSMTITGQAAKLMGIPGYKEQIDSVSYGQDEQGNYTVPHVTPGPKPEHFTDEARTILTEIHNARPVGRSLYSGVRSGTERFLDLKPGDTVKLPTTATSYDRDLAHQSGVDTTKHADGVVLKFEGSTRAVRYMHNVREFITAGEFRVKSIRERGGMRGRGEHHTIKEITLVQTGTFDPATGAITASAEEFACHDASCRPPTSGGTGGSRRRAGFSGVSALPDRERPTPRFHGGLTEDSMDAAGVGWEHLPPTKRAEKFVASWYDAKLPNGYTIKVKAENIMSGTLFTVEGTIHNEYGRQVGSFEREINFDMHGPEHRDYGTTVVKHETLVLEASAQGKGIADALNAHSMEMYRKYGVDRIETHAGYDVGGYTWAVAGFRIEGSVPRHEEIAQLMNDGVKYKLPQLMKEGHLTEEQRDDVLHKLNALREASLAGEDIQPIHIASLGEDTHKFKREGNSGDPYTTWVGKELLLGRNWEGVYYLAKEPVTASVTISFGGEFTMIEHPDTTPQEEGDINATRDWAEVHAQVAEYVKEYGEK